ncbi:MAG: sensor histidine kinase [Polyangiales bacterium]
MNTATQGHGREAGRIARHEAGFDSRDATFAGVRALALAGLAAWAWLSLEAGPTRDGVLVMFCIFVPYCGLLYVAGARILRSRAKDTFYFVAGLSDLAFLAMLIRTTGGIRGPFTAALPAWTALYASYFGLRGGLVVAAASLALTAGFGLAAHVTADPWRVLGHVWSAAVYGPVLGHLFDCAGLERRSQGASRDELASTNQRLLQEQTSLIEAEKHRSVAVLAAGLAHEINNPLSGIMQCARALSEGTVPEARKADYVNAILEAVARLRSVVDGVRDYARQRAALPSDLDAAEVVSSCLQMVTPLCEEAGVRVESSLTPGTVRIRADGAQLRKALSNVVLNAVYFSARGDCVSISAARRGYMWGVAVTDHGPGIPKENLSKVTDPFFTTKPPGEGTGLGLAITYGVLRSFGGELELASEAGKGTTVTMWLPAAGGPRA